MTVTWLRHGVVVLAFLFMPGTLASAQPRPAVSEAEIQAQVESRLFDAGLIGVRVEVRQRTVTLTGSVDSLYLKDQAVRQARKVHEVEEVVDSLTVTPGEGDESLALEVAGDISASVYFSIFDDVSIHVADGIATLTGYVTAPLKSREFTDVTSRVPGVQRVVNRIEVLPVSMMDDDLRYAIASAIYGNAMFSQYALQRPGPIHIIVNRGHVTLTGIVASEAERNAAGMFARNAFGIMELDNRLRVEKE